jgi:preprotein translocase subunit SecG
MILYLIDLFGKVLWKLALILVIIWLITSLVVVYTYYDGHSRLTASHTDKPTPEKKNEKRPFGSYKL